MKFFILLTILFVLITNTHAKERKTIPVSVQKELIEVFTINEELHNAFFDYDKQIERIPKIAEGLRLKIGEISDESIRKLLVYSQGQLKEMNSKDSKAKNNQRYHLVSMALIHILNSYDIGSDYNAYSCPMVKKKWVQNSKKIAKVHNPYDATMPHCGSQDSKY